MVVVRMFVVGMIVVRILVVRIVVVHFGRSALRLPSSCPPGWPELNWALGAVVTAFSFFLDFFFVVSFSLGCLFILDFFSLIIIFGALFFDAIINR